MKRKMLITILLLMISSYSLMLSPAADFDSDGFTRILAYMIGIVFWLCLISAYVIFIIVNKERRKKKRSRNKIKQKPAALTFFSSKPAAVADIETMSPDEVIQLAMNEGFDLDAYRI